VARCEVLDEEARASILKEAMSESLVPVPSVPLLRPERLPGDLSLYRGETASPSELNLSAALDLSSLEAEDTENEEKVGKGYDEKGGVEDRDADGYDYGYDDEETAEVVLSPEEVLLQRALAREIIPKMEAPERY